LTDFAEIIEETTPDVVEDLTDFAEIIEETTPDVVEDTTPDQETDTPDQESCYEKISTVISQASGECVDVACHEDLEKGEFSLSVKGEIQDTCSYEIKKSGHTGVVTVKLSSKSQAVQGTINFGKIKSDGAESVSSKTGTSVEARIIEHDSQKAEATTHDESGEFPGEVTTLGEGTDFSVMLFTRESDGHKIIKVTSYESELTTIYKKPGFSLDIGTTPDGAGIPEGITVEYDVTAILEATIPDFPEFPDPEMDQMEGIELEDSVESGRRKPDDGCSLNLINIEQRSNFKLVLLGMLALIISMRRRSNNQ
jgi:hypothetical protein